MISSDYWRERCRLALDTYGIQIVAQPAVEPISIEEARSHLRLTASGSPEEHPDDGQIMNVYIPAAREWCEFYSGELLATQTVELSLEAFPGGTRFYLPLGPVQSIESLVYLDADGVETTMTLTTDYLTRIYRGRASISLPDDVVWPTPMAYAYGEPVVFVRYVAGYTSESPDTYPLPRVSKAAMLLVLGHLYENREDTVEKALERIPLGAAALLDRHGVRLGFA